MPADVKSERKVKITSAKKGGRSRLEVKLDLYSLTYPGGQGLELKLL